MKQKLILYLFIALITFSAIISCGGKTKTTSETEDRQATKNLSEIINIAEINFNDNWNQIYNKKGKLNRAQYDSLKLGSLSFMYDYDALEYQIGKKLIETNNRKLLTVKAISSGEIAEYLLGYVDNNITDSLLIAYEDAVEYFSATSSIIEGNQIKVTTINWDYANNSQEEVSDTIVTIYNITPLLTFDEIID